MSKLIVKSTNKKGETKVKEFTEKQATKALAFMLKEFTKGNKITREIVENEESQSK